MTRKLMGGKGWSFEPAKDDGARPHQTHPRGQAPLSQERVRIGLENRSGKLVTVIGGLTRSERDLSQIAKSLKMSCGTGGTVKERKIELQGDRREQVRTWMNKNGWKIQESG